MINFVINFILIGLFIFTPIAFGSVELWAFSLMELGILLIIIIWAIQSVVSFSQSAISLNSELQTSHFAFKHSRINPVTVCLFLFLFLVLIQMISLPSSIVKLVSPKTYKLYHELLMTNDQLPVASLSFVPFITKIEFFKWLTLSGFFLFLLYWKRPKHSITNHLFPVIMLAGIVESLYGMLEFFSGHRHILYLNGSSLVSSVTGTFINRNHFAGYLLMVIPLSVGYLFSREALQKGRFMGWRHRLSSLDGKTLLIGFGIIIMIVGLLFSASRMGILSLLLSFSLMALLFRDPQRKQRFLKTPVLILALALLWAAWIGLDAVISRFFSISESFEERWKIWVDTFQILKDFPLFGSGLGTFSQIFPMYRSFHIRAFVTHAENDFLQLTSEVGLVGIGLLVILFIYLFFKAVSGIRSLSSRDLNRYVGMGGIVGILALMFHSIVERNIQVPANAFLFTFLLAIVFRIGLTKRRPRLA